MLKKRSDFIIWFLDDNPTRGRARGGGNGAFAPPSQNCYVPDRMEFSPLLYKILILIAFFKQKCPIAPPIQISGFATESNNEDYNPDPSVPY